MKTRTKELKAAYKKRNPNDLTLRNLRAIRKELARLEAYIKVLKASLKK